MNAFFRSKQDVLSSTKNYNKNTDKFKPMGSHNLSLGSFRKTSYQETLVKPRMEGKIQAVQG